MPLLLLALVLSLCASAAGAQETGATSFLGWTWNVLDPQDDVTAEVIRGAFPVAGSGGGAGEVENQRTVFALLLGMATAFIGLLAMAHFLYDTVMQTVWAGERGRVVDEKADYLASLRVTLAVLLVLPLPGLGGTNVGQQAVVRLTLGAIGATRLVWQEAFRALGPDAVPIVRPIVPGTKTVVAGLLDNELCRALVNAVANNPSMVPAPAPVMGGQGAGAYISWHYRMATGNARGAPWCGTVTVRQSGGADQGIPGVDTDMAERQRAILQQVVEGTLRPAAEAAAAEFRATREPAAFQPLWQALRSGADEYAGELVAAASEVQRRIRARVTAEMARGGEATRNAERMAALGWLGAGAYALTIADVNGHTLSILSSTPVVNPPTWDPTNLGVSMARDLRGLASAALGFRTAIQTHAQTLDGQDVPGGYADLFTGIGPGEDGAGVLERLLRSMRLNERVLEAFVEMTSPARQMFANPFAAQIALGHKLMLAALTALGMMAVLGSTPLAAGVAAASLLSGNVAGAAAAATGSMVVQLLGSPLFYGLLLLLVPGILLAFVLPMLPFGIWFARAIGWLIQVFEIIIAVPLWAWAMIRWRGEGLHGHGFHGFAMTGSMLVTPIFMLIGLFLGWVVYAFAAWFLQLAFTIPAGIAISKGWLVTNVIGVGVLSCCFVTLHIVATVQSFRLISVTPHHVVSYARLLAGNRVDVDGVAAAAGMAATLGAIQSMAGAALESARTAGAGRQAALAGDGGPPRIGSDRTLSAATDVAPPRGQGRST